MEIIILLPGSFVILYISFYCIKSILFYRSCMLSERSGEFVECEGIVSELIEEKKKAMHGELVSVSYPYYRTVHEGGELFYRSVVMRINVNIGQPVDLFFNKQKGLLWAKGDLPLLKKHIIKKLITICILSSVLVITVFLL